MVPSRGQGESLEKMTAPDEAEKSKPPSGVTGKLLDGINEMTDRVNESIKETVSTGAEKISGGNKYGANKYIFMVLKNNTLPIITISKCI
jgi:hypothetical protein